MNSVEYAHQIHISSRSESIAEVENFIDQIREEYGIGDDVYGNILISMTEAVNNAIIHGNKMDAAKKVSVSCKANRDQSIVFKVADVGAGFDFEHLPDPTDPENLEKLSGRGVFLMRQLSDNLQYTNGGNTVEMEFKF